eukprot:544056_1
MSSFKLNLLAVFILLKTIYGVVIPTINLSDANEMSAKILFDAATKYGFFQITNHAITVDIREEILRLSKDFFDLDLNIKTKLSSNATHWGYIEYQAETIDSIHQKQGDTKEGFYIHNQMKNKNSNETHPLCLQNQWPSSNLLPNWRTAIENYMNTLHSISIKLSKLFALSLNLSMNYFEQPGIRDNSIDLLYLLHYSKQKSDINNGIFGTGQHTDYDLFTILLTDNNPGLQILFENEWIDIEYNPNSLIINIADTLQKWTNDLFKSAMHRVVMKGKYDRYSVPYFVSANYNLIIDCLPNTVIVHDETYSKCNHEPFKSGEYLGYKLQQTTTNYQKTAHKDFIHSDL